MSACGNASMSVNTAADSAIDYELVGSWLLESQVAETYVDGTLIETEDHYKAADTTGYQFLSNGAMVSCDLMGPKGNYTWSADRGIILIGNIAYKYSIDGDKLTITNVRYYMSSEMSESLCEYKNIYVYTKKEGNIIDCIGEFCNNYMSNVK